MVLKTRMKQLTEKSHYSGKLSNHRKCMVCGNHWELAIPPCGVSAVREMWVLRPGSSCPRARQQFLSHRNLVERKAMGLFFPETVAHGNNWLNSLLVFHMFVPCWPIQPFILDSSLALLLLATLFKWFNLSVFGLLTGIKQSYLSWWCISLKKNY